MPNESKTDGGVPSPAASCSALRIELIRIAGLLLRVSASIPTELDQIEWCKTTPRAERVKVIADNRKTSDAIKTLAVRIGNAAKSIGPND